MSEDNHYIPIFYQKRWAGSDHRVCVYSRPYKLAHVMRKHPAGVGYECNLYTVPNIDPTISSYLEGVFFKITDDLAAIALTIIEAGQWETMEIRIRSAWTRFIMSLLHRNPEQIRKFIVVVSQFMDLTKPRLEEEFQLSDDQGDFRTFDEFWQDRSPTIVAKTWIRLTQMVIDSQFVGNHFNNLVWRVIKLNSDYTLLTGDRPIIMTNGMNLPDSHLALPIGPRKLFVAAPTSDVADKIVRRNANEVAAFANDRIVRQARRFCIGTNDGHLPLFRKRFGERAPSSPVETAPFPTAEELLELAGSRNVSDAKPMTDG
jgi:hypothetical protein